MCTTDLIIRELTPADEASFREAHRILESEDVPFGLGFEPSMSWAAYLQHRDDQKHGRNLGAWVPSTFLVGVVNERLVGRVSVRHELNDFLRRKGGHIGYCVLPDYRGRGFATQLLKRGIDVARSYGNRELLITCDVDNLASERVIEKCGGVLMTVDNHLGVKRFRIGSLG